jgi:hypothetical protein
MSLLASQGDAPGLLIGILIWAVGGAAFAGWVAHRKGRSVAPWALLGFFFGAWAIAVVALLPAKNAAGAAGAFRYKLHTARGDLGTATYPAMIQPGEEILYLDGRSFRVLGVLPEDKDSPFIGQLEVEAVSGSASRQ